MSLGSAGKRYFKQRNPCCMKQYQRCKFWRVRIGSLAASIPEILNGYVEPRAVCVLAWPTNALFGFAERLP